MPEDLDGLLRPTLRHLVGITPGPQLAAAVAAEGWQELDAVDRAVALRVLFDELGRAGATTTALDFAVAELLDLDRPVTCRVLFPDVVAPDGTARGLAFGGWDGSPETVVLIGADGAVAVAPVVAAPAMPIAGIDPDAGITRVAVSDLAIAASRLLDAATAATTIAAVRRLLAGQMLGGCAVLVGLAVRHASDRTQFGRPIGSFQAVRHLLADAHVAVRAATAALDDAWATGAVLEANVAKALAGRAGAATISASQQVLGAIGFTWEHAHHTYARRMMLLDVLAGSAAWLAGELGAGFIAEASVARTGRFREAT